MAAPSRHPALSDPEAALRGSADAPVGDPRRRPPALLAKAPYVAYRFGSVVARTLPARLVGPAASAAGALLSYAMRPRRAMLRRHLRRVHGPDVDGATLDREVRLAFASYARYWAESFRLPGSTPGQLAAAMTSEGLENVDRGLAAGNGVVLALPHLGGWDFGGAWLASLGYKVAAVVEAVDPPELFEWFAQLRRSLGFEVVALGPGAGTTALRRLRANCVVALVCDRDLGGGGVEVEFFGERTTLPGGPATLALRSGAALLPSAVYFRPGGGHHAVMGPPLEALRQGRLRDDVARVTQAIACELESLIRRAPDQWHLLQPNWPSDRQLSP